MTEIQGLPELLVTLGRQRLSPTALADVVTVQVRQVLAQPAQCEIAFQVPDPLAGGPLGAAPGDALRIELGGHRSPLFVGEVTVVEHEYAANSARTLRVRAYDALHRTRKRRSTRLHPPGDLAALTAVLTDGTALQVAGGEHPLGSVYQCGESDLALLTRVAADCGRYPVVDGDLLRLVGLGGEGEPLDLELGTTLHAADLEISQEPAFRSAAVHGWHPERAVEVTGRAGDSAAGARVRADPAPGAVGGGGALLRTNAALPDERAADALALAELDVRAAREVAGELVAEGDPRLRAGRRVQVRGVAESLEGVYTVCSCTHVINRGGYETVVSTRPPTTPSPPRPDVVTLGVVDDADDPEGRGRALVRLPAFGDLVTGWAPVLVAGAGQGKGAVVLPAPRDTVLVLVVASDPADAVVLGGLYGLEPPPDADLAGARGGRYTLRTSDGQQIVLDAAEPGLRISDGHGSVVELGPEVFRIRSATDLVLEAPGRGLRIRARTVDFEEAP
ncbi:phage baseplate assembly protein V [Kocuria rhizosphaericola]|uniref:phage baseplate assembly protein V n=1 Tax=Kocuria rhizosphaericola TaxID=3376284 RepID=UPI0037A3389A